MTHVTSRTQRELLTQRVFQIASGYEDGNADFIFGLPGNAILTEKAEGLMKNARGPLEMHLALAPQNSGPAVSVVQMFGEFEYAAKSRSQTYRVVLKVEVLQEPTANQIRITSVSS